MTKIFTFAKNKMVWVLLIVFIIFGGIILLLTFSGIALDKYLSDNFQIVSSAENLKKGDGRMYLKKNNIVVNKNRFSFFKKEFVILFEERYITKEKYIDGYILYFNRKSVFSEWQLKSPIYRLTFENSTLKKITKLVRQNENILDIVNDNKDFRARKITNMEVIRSRKETKPEHSNQDFPTCKEMDPELKEQLEAQQDPNYDGIKKRYYNPNCPKYNTG